MPKSKVIADAVNGDVTLEQSLRRLEVLAHDVRNERLEHWAECELNGYGDEEVPDYRIATSLNFTYSGFNNGAFKVTNAPLSISLLDTKTIDEMKDVPMKDGIAAISKWIDKGPIVHIDRSFLAGEVEKRTEGRVICTSIAQSVPVSFYEGVVAKVTTCTIRALMLLEDQYGCLDGLGIDISSRKAAMDSNAVINGVIFNNVPVDAVEKKEGFGSKIAWKVIVPIITAVVGSVLTVLVIGCLQLG